MANTIIAFNNYANFSTITGGGWEPGQSLTNLKFAGYDTFARSINASPTNTFFNIDLLASRPVRVFMFARHNLSASATYRIRRYTDGTFTTANYDSGNQAVWHASGPDETNRAGYLPALTFCPPEGTSGQFWRVNFNDTVNPFGYVQIARLFMAGAWQPTLNMEYGLQQGFESRSQVAETYDGSEFYDVRESYRVERFRLQYLPLQELLDNAMDMDANQGITGEVAYVFDPDDTQNMLRRSFLGRMRQLTPIEYPFFDIGTKAFELKQLIGGAVAAITYMPPPPPPSPAPPAPAPQPDCSLVTILDGGGPTSTYAGTCNIDGGGPDSNYGATSPIDGGVIT